MELYLSHSLRFIGDSELVMTCRREGVRIGDIFVFVDLSKHWLMVYAHRALTALQI